MSLRILIALGCILVWIGIGPLQAQDFFEQGTKAYEEKDFAQAENYYSRALAAGHVSLSILYNLANTYAQQGKSGKAIVGYERVLAQNPLHKAAKQNLILVRQRAGLPASQISWWRKPFSWLNLNYWTLVFTFSFLIFTSTFLVHVWRRYKQIDELSQTWISPLALRGWMIVAALGVGLGMLGICSTLPLLKKAVVVREGALLHISPFESAIAVATLRDGQMLELNSYFPQPHQNFWPVHNQEGKIGWVAQKDFERIVSFSP